MSELSQAEQRHLIAEYKDDKDVTFDNEQLLLEHHFPRVDGVKIQDVLGERIDIDIHSLAERYHLTEQESKVFNTWLQQGLLSNTPAWFGMVRRFFSEDDVNNITRDISTLLFIDTFNRADSIYDENRKLFENNGVSTVTPEIVEGLPILREKGKSIRVREMKAVLEKIIKNSGDFSSAECGHIGWLLEDFLDSSTHMQQVYEGRYKYSFDEAHALRYGTVAPFVDVMSNLFSLSRSTIKSGDEEQKAHRKMRDFLNTVLAWQLSDDLYDYDLDREKSNINLVAGIMNDEGEFIDQLPEEVIWDGNIDIDEFVHTFPRTAKRMKKVYQQWTAHLIGKDRFIIDSCVPKFLLNNFEQEEEDTSYEDNLLLAS